MKYGQFFLTKNLTQTKKGDKMENLKVFENIGVTLLLLAIFLIALVLEVIR